MATAFRENPSIISTSRRAVYEQGINLIAEVAEELTYKPQNEQSKKVIDAFEVISKDQIVAALDLPGYLLIFNKYNVSSKHYLLVSTSLVHELELLELDVFEGIEEMLLHEELIGVFNGGRLAGSSEPRQHVQFLNIDTPLLDQYEESGDVVGHLSHFDGKLHGICTLASHEPHYLMNVYHRLLKECRIAISEPIYRSDIPEDYPEHPDFPEMQKLLQCDEGMCQVAIDSYSLIITSRVMFMCKREKDGIFNSIAFSGNIFLKSEELFDEYEHVGFINSLREVMASE